MLGCLVADKIKTWVWNHPVPTQLQKDLEAHKVRLTEFTSVNYKGGDARIEVYDKEWVTVTYKYDSYEDAADDLDYCKSKFKPE